MESEFLMAVSKHRKWLQSTVICAYSGRQKHHSVAGTVDPVAVGGEELIGLRATEPIH